ncbi:hypothetical protein ABEB36_015120 [Hypothenemus hampei]|uniref:Transposase n=1 Tax=Hypothenemus hampei TaxID=57062 RepID=A0ABD1E2I9_HYPHA
MCEILPPTLTARGYLDFLNRRIHEFLEDIPLNERAHIWYQQDGAPAHYGLAVRAWLDEHFPQQ